MHLEDRIPADPESTIWDVIVIGTGAGGGPAGFNLARLGRSVLFVERGKLHQGTRSDAANSSFVYLPGTIHSCYPPRHTLRAASRPDDTSALTVAYGVGGTTSVFSMVMDRFRPIDMHLRSAAQVPTDSSAPDAWPIQYEDLEPYYRQAEAMFRVRGTHDPLNPTRCTLQTPDQPSDTENLISDTLTRAQLHPYRLHYAREHLPNCDGCPLKPCAYNCRNDSGRLCVVPALEQYGAHILPDCLVVRLETRARSVHRAICNWMGRRIAIRGRLFVLALNALYTPALLLRSANDLFPDGLGNRSGTVGRNLMLHVSDCLYVKFKARRGLLNALMNNGLSLNDFYVRDGVKLGNIHAHAMDLSQITGKHPLDSAAGTVVFSTIVEDFPYLENRVVPKRGSEDKIYWEYHYSSELGTRSEMLVKAFADTLKPECDVSVCQPSGSLNPTHACGTCRSGNDPQTSVLDRDNRIHELDNAYVVDASFFPSSGGINPSLTIVANSLRVSELIARR